MIKRILALLVVVTFFMLIAASRTVVVADSAPYPDFSHAIYQCAHWLGFFTLPLLIVAQCAVTETALWWRRRNARTED